MNILLAMKVYRKMLLLILFCSFEEICKEPGGTALVDLCEERVDPALLASVRRQDHPQVKSHTFCRWQSALLDELLRVFRPWENLEMALQNSIVMCMRKLLPNANV